MTENRAPGKEKPRNRKGYGGFLVMRKMGLEPASKGLKAARDAVSRNLGHILGHTFFVWGRYTIQTAALSRFMCPINFGVGSSAQEAAKMAD